MIARMAPDDAADLIVEIDQDRRARVLALLPPSSAARSKRCSATTPPPPHVMSPDFVALAPAEQAEQALAAVRASDLGAGTLTTVFLLDADRRLCGSVFVVTLLRSEPHTPLQDIAEHEPVFVPTDADLPEVARTMSDYNLVMLAVVNKDGRLARLAITVDDVLGRTLPAGWRRRYGVVSD